MGLASIRTKNPTKASAAASHNEEMHRLIALIPDTAIRNTSSGPGTPKLESTDLQVLRLTISMNTTGFDLEVQTGSTKERFMSTNTEKFHIIATPTVSYIFSRPLTVRDLLRRYATLKQCAWVLTDIVVAHDCQSDRRQKWRMAGGRY